VSAASFLRAWLLAQIACRGKYRRRILAFSEMLKEWKASRGHRENLLMPGARRVGVASVANPRSPYRKFWAMVITDCRVSSLRSQGRRDVSSAWPCSATG
jgi:hypothetical protein